MSILSSLFLPPSLNTEIDKRCILVACQLGGYLPPSVNIEIDRRYILVIRQFGSYLPPSVNIEIDRRYILVARQLGGYLTRSFKNTKLDCPATLLPYSLNAEID